MAHMLFDYSDKNPDLRSLYPRHVEALCARHDRALEAAGAGAAVIFSGSLKYAFLDDQPYPFRPNPHFISWVPLLELPDSCIVYVPGAKPQLIYFQPRDYWHVTPGEPDGYWTGSFDIRVVHDAGDVARNLPADRNDCILIGEIADAQHEFGIERINPAAAMNILHHARSIKTEYELACMRLASRRAAYGHFAAAAALQAEASEYEIHRAYCRTVRHTDFELPYGNIIALNEHGAVLHYTDLDRDQPDEFRSLLIDAGAQVHGYAADITRTHAAGDTRFQNVIDRMDDLQRDVVGRVRAGVDFRELHLETHRLLADVLLEVGLASGDADALVSTGVTAAFFPHGLGHLLGVQVHDVGGFMANASGDTVDPPPGHPFLRLTRVLEEDMVVTIEPGLYVIDMLLEELKGTPAAAHLDWDTVDWLRPFGGVRIEDDVRVLAGGSENFTRNAFAAIS